MMEEEKTNVLCEAEEHFHLNSNKTYCLCGFIGDSIHFKGNLLCRACEDLFKDDQRAFFSQVHDLRRTAASLQEENERLKGALAMTSEEQANKRVATMSVMDKIIDYSFDTAGIKYPPITDEDETVAIAVERGFVEESMALFEEKE